jgi:hypothetical protein
MEFGSLANKKKKAIGSIPCVTWLRRNGFSGLDFCIRTRPELFSHMTQDYEGGRLLEEIVSDAEKLEKKYRELPSHKWLKENNKGYISGAIFRNRDAFSHIKQKKLQKTLEEHVLDAEKLEKQYGILPNNRWLTNNNKSGLAYQMNIHPEAFSHIKQKKMQKTLEEHVLDAEQLEKKYGKLPFGHWLKNNNKTGLLNHMTKHPKAFSHIKQQKTRKTLKEHVLDAEKLEKQYNKLPCCFWLRKNKKTGLAVKIKEHPEAFSHIRQDKKIITIKEWIGIAKNLIEKNNGKLPSYKWIRNSKEYRGLGDCLYNHPEAFKGMKQEYRKGVRIIGE